jgi:hypothetical protein
LLFRDKPLVKSLKNQTIFKALQALEGLGFADLREHGIYAKLEILIAFLENTNSLTMAGGEKHLNEIEQMIGIPSAVGGFVLGLLRLNLGARV